MHRVLLTAVCLLAAAGCGERARTAVMDENAGQPADLHPQRVDAAHLPNAWRVHPRVISGGQPAGETAFRELAELGVKTVISVDGARPDLAAANKHGLKYVHLPHGYDGVSHERAQQLAKAIRDLPGPVYIHCHHGKHRSPAAAAVGCVAAGLLPPAAAEGILLSAGTSPAYQGLYESARSARPMDAKLLDALAADFHEAAELPPLAEAMVALERTHDHLLEIAAAGWRSPPDHPDLDPPHEALLLGEHFAELLRTDDVAGRPEEFRQLLRDSEAAAGELEAALRQLAESSSSSAAEQAGAALSRITAACQACHTPYRDAPR